MIDFSGKVALVTGGSSGIGRASAIDFATKGAHVVIAARREKEGEETVEMVKNQGVNSLFVKTDVSKSDEVKSLVQSVISEFGRLDFAFNNAGIEGSAFVPTADYEEEVWDRVIDINLKGVWLCMKYQIPEIIKTKGSIVNMSSVAGLQGGSIGIAYYASKHGVVGMTKSSAMEYARLGVRINAVAPAVISTDMADRAFFSVDEEFAEKIVKSHPLGRVGTSEEVASAVSWLCSDEAGFITGHTLPIDGGRLI